MLLMIRISSLDNEKGGCVCTQMEEHRFLYTDVIFVLILLYSCAWCVCMWCVVVSCSFSRTCSLVYMGRNFMACGDECNHNTFRSAMMANFKLSTISSRSLSEA